MSERIIIDDPVVTDSVYGQCDLLILATHRLHGENLFAGYLNYTEFEDVIKIGYILVPASLRYTGIATSMVKKLYESCPGQRIEWGMMTEEGAYLRAKCSQEEWYH